MDTQSIKEIMMGIGKSGHDGDLSVSMKDPNRNELSTILEEVNVDLNDSRVSVERQLARRPVFIVSEDEVPLYVLKMTGSQLSSIENETHMLQIIEEEANQRHHNSIISDIVPSVIHKSSRVLICPYLKGLPYSKYIDGNTKPNAPLEERIGQSLRAVHKIKEKDIVQEKTLDRYLNFPVSLLDDLSLDQYSRGIGLDFHAYAKLLQECSQELNSMCSKWHTETLIHCDIRFDNVIVSEDDDLPKLIDWELSGFGDPLYDLGCLLSERIAVSLYSSSRNEQDNDWLISAINYSKGYFSDTPYSRETIIKELETTIRYAGIGLIYKILGRLERTGSFGRIGHTMALSAKKLILQPLDIARAIGNSLC